MFILMNGIYYNRHDLDKSKSVWREVKHGESIILEKESFLQIFPDMEVIGKIEYKCENHGNSFRGCEDCDSRCGCSVELFLFKNALAASHSNSSPTISVGKFAWEWSGEGVTEHWFDSDAICLKAVSDYSSNSGLTADDTCIIAYTRHIEVSSFRTCCKETLQYGRDKVAAEFVNAPAGYRANWTGFAISENFIGDDLDKIILMELEGNGTIMPTVCRHNRNVQIKIVTSDPKKIPYFLCRSCRIKSIRWDEFVSRNRKDVCPYLRRACKSAIEKSDPLPKWFQWKGENLISSYQRMDDGEDKVYEVSYIRRRDGFIRSSVLLLNSRTREAWLYKYNGFIPRTYAEFKNKDKYPNSEGYQILGYLGTEYDRDDGFLSREKIEAAILEGFGKPVLNGTKESVADFSYNHTKLLPFVFYRGIVNGLEIDSFSDGEKDLSEPFTDNPTPILSEKGWNYYLLSVWGYKKIVVIRKKLKEILRLNCEDGNGLYVLKVKSK